MPAESRGFSDVLATAADGPQTAPDSSGRVHHPESIETSERYAGPGPRSPIMHFGNLTPENDRNYEDMRRLCALL